MAQKQLVKRSRQSFTRLARFFNQRSVEVRLTDAGQQTYAFFAQLQLFSSNSHFLLTSFFPSCIPFFQVSKRA